MCLMSMHLVEQASMEKGVTIEFMMLGMEFSSVDRCG